MSKGRFYHRSFIIHSYIYKRSLGFLSTVACAAQRSRLKQIANPMSQPKTCFCMFTAVNQLLSIYDCLAR